ncbi:hypothetical protein RhiirB3_429563 [Rhizophagus irregularis]|nr:hypothetical protein RhiirB3_429563 [Rhizophagus irregularis]
MLPPCLAGSLWSPGILYIECWRNKPDERPEINQVISELNNVNPEINFNFQVNELTEELKNEDGFSDCDLSNY